MSSDVKSSQFALARKFGAQYFELSLLILLISLWMVLRLYGLDLSPPGFAVDEGGSGTNIMCLIREGTAANGVPYPFYAAHFDGDPYEGIVSPVFLYPAALWALSFGDSILAMRAFVAFVNIIGIYFLYLLGTTLRERKLGLWFALCGAASVWSFQLSRINWDASIAAPLLIIGLYYLARPTSYRSSLLAGLFLSASMYAYTPAQITTPLVLFAFFLARIKPLSRQTLGTFAVISLSALHLFLRSALATRPTRFSLTGFLHPEYLKGIDAPYPHALFYSFLQKLYIHLDPAFLFWAGDKNLRHSPSGFGQWGTLELLALIVFLVAVGVKIVTHRTDKPNTPFLTKDLALILVFAAASYMIAIIPAALTWEGLPHALRSNLSWPFLSIAAGIVLYSALRAEPLFGLSLFVPILWFSYTFPKHYFTTYRKQASSVFEQRVHLAAREARDGRVRWDVFVKVFPNKEAAHLRYYLMSQGGMGCLESRLYLSRLRDSPR